MHINISKQTPASSPRITQYLWLLPALVIPPLTLNLSLPGPGLPSCPPAWCVYNPAILAIWGFWPLACPLGWWLLSCLFFLLSLLSWSGLNCWPCSAWTLSSTIRIFRSRHVLLALFYFFIHSWEDCFSLPLIYLQATLELRSVLQFVYGLYWRQAWVSSPKSPCQQF